MPADSIVINRAPVLTLWAAVVAERLGFDGDAALSLGRGIAGLNAQSKGRMIGIFQPAKGPEGGPPKKVGLGEEFWVELCGRGVPAKNTDDGVRAVVKDQPIKPDAVQKYLAQKFGDDLESARAVLRDLAESYDVEELARQAYALYEKFRPKIPSGRAGWGAKGKLDLDLIRSLAARP